MRLPMLDRDLTFVIATALLAGIAGATALVPLASLGALALVLWLPGYAFTVLLFPGSQLDSAIRVVLSVLLSLFVTTVVTLLAHLTPWGINRISLLISLPLISVVLVMLAAVRRTRSGEHGVMWRPQLPLSTWLGLTVAVAVVVFALQLARTPAPDTIATAEGYTVLWITPPSTADDPLQLRIHSNEFASLRYTLRLEVADNVLAAWENIVLAPGEYWSVAVPPPIVQTPTLPIRGVLVRADQPEQVYREVFWYPQKPYP